MSSLRKLQLNFANYLLGDVEDIESFVTDDKKVGRQTRLRIYKNAYQVRLKKCIESDHPVLCTYLGDTLFEELATGYIEKNPSRFTSLRYFCDALPEYLATIAPFIEVPILAEIASLERLMLTAFDAAEAEVLSLETFQSIPPEQWPDMKLVFHPSVHIFTANWNSVESWQAIKQENTPEPATQFEQREYWLIWRGSDHLTQFRSLPEVAWLMLNAFQQGKCFADICEMMLDYLAEEDIGIRAVTILKTWLEYGVVTGISCDSSGPRK